MTQPEPTMESEVRDEGNRDAASGSAKKQKSRHRASVACATCRERRIRCVVPPESDSCLQCQRSGSHCVIKNDDERRRPISRAYMSTLTDRVSLLEAMLKEKGAEPPPVVYPPKTTRGSLHADGDDSPASSLRRLPQPSDKRDSVIIDDTSPRSGVEESLEDSNRDSSASVEGQLDHNEKEAGVGTPLDDKRDGLVSRLLSTRGHLSFDQLSGRLRFYGGTVNCHIYSELEVDDSTGSRQATEQSRRAEKCIRTLPIETHDYLIDLFWQHYNAVIHVVHKDAFLEDREKGRTEFYSGFLHVCILAMGYRFADKTRPDMQRIALPARESTLHREAKYMLDLELERPGDLTSIAALLVLGDAEVGVGRDNVGWMYSGMAMRLCYDLGLHLDTRQVGLSQRQLEIRRMTLWACVIYDRYWSLFLGRPLTMKIADLEIYALANQFERLGTCMPAGLEKSLDTRVFEALIELMEIAGKIVESADFRKHQDTSQRPDQQAYFKMVALDRELHNWMSRLPQDLRYNEENRAHAPYSFYLLHQQYHAIIILLHRPFARYDDMHNDETEEVSALDSHFSRASRTICTKSAVTMAQIFWQHRQKFDGKQIFSTGMQHAGAAATALIAALAYMPNMADRNNNMQYLEVLHAALQDMAHGYQLAERMAAVLNAAMIELRGGPINAGNTAIPARRAGEHEQRHTSAPNKRRQTSRTSNRTGAMQPPTTTARSHRVSDAGSERSTYSQPQQPQHIDFVNTTPRSETTTWPNISEAPMMPTQQALPTPDTLPIPSPEQRQKWISQVGPEASHTHSMPHTPGLQDGELANLEFLHMPSDDDWTRWHSMESIDVATDLDGFPPRGRYQTNNLASPPMGSIMNG